MLFIAERVAELAAVSSREFPPLCATAYVLDNAKTVASVMIETFMVILPCVAPLKSRRGAQITTERPGRLPYLYLGSAGFRNHFTDAIESIPEFADVTLHGLRCTAAIQLRHAGRKMNSVK
jgi:hypothetical protein